MRPEEAGKFSVPAMQGLSEKSLTNLVDNKPRRRESAAAAAVHRALAAGRTTISLTSTCDGWEMA